MVRFNIKNICSLLVKPYCENGEIEVRALLEDETIEVELLSKKYGKKVYYNKYLTLNQEYGVSIIWD